MSFLSSAIRSRGHTRSERLVQVAAVHQQIGRAVFRFSVCAKRQLVRQLAGVPVAIGPGVRLERGGANAWLKPDAAQHPHCIRAHLDASAEANKARRLLVDLCIDAALVERGRKREPAHPGADDRKRGCHEGHNATREHAGPEDARRAASGLHWRCDARMEGLGRVTE